MRRSGKRGGVKIFNENEYVTERRESRDDGKRKRRWKEEGEDRNLEETPNPNRNIIKDHDLRPNKTTVSRGKKNEALTCSTRGGKRSMVCLGGGLRSLSRLLY